MREINRKLVLEDGSEYYGCAFGSKIDRVCEIVFNTSMSGYQEIVSDLSYTDQMVVMTYPLIGNYGMAEDDYECKFPSIGGLCCYDYNDTPSNFRWVKTLSESLEEYNPRHFRHRYPEAHPQHPGPGLPKSADHRTGYSGGKGSGNHRRHPCAPGCSIPGQLQKALVFPDGGCKIQRGGHRLRYEAEHHPLFESVRLQCHRGPL